jgi:hypothetical protein
MYFKLDLSFYMFVIIFLIKTNGQSCKEKSTSTNILKRLEYYFSHVRLNTHYARQTKTPFCFLSTTLVLVGRARWLSRVLAHANTQFRLRKRTERRWLPVVHQTRVSPAPKDRHHPPMTSAPPTVRFSLFPFLTQYFLVKTNLSCKLTYVSFFSWKESAEQVQQKSN